jgi:manganese transport protein
MSALFINGAILVVSAAAFHGTGHENVADISDAYTLLSPLLGATLASTLFAVGLLLSGQNATLTGTLAGQIVMEGFLNLRLRPWLRRLVTRAAAIVPALVVVVVSGDRGAGSLIVLSQVVLSLQLPFAIFPLVLFVSDRNVMGRLAIGMGLKLLAWPAAILIAGLNLWLLVQVLAAWL